MSSRIESLPLFPLGLVLYPNERLPLHIFEERYKDLTQYCLTEDAPFGIVLFQDGRMADVGTTARIDRVVQRYDDGRMDIVVFGEQRYKLDDVYEQKSYMTADVELIEENEPIINPQLRERAITQHIKLLELAGRTVRPDLYENVEYLSFVLAQNAGLDDEQKQEVLEIEEEADRIRFLVDHFESLIPQIEEEKSVRRKVRSNGHFKDFPPEEAE
jgi:ATP-dependent Lon protease